MIRHELCTVTSRLKSHDRTLHGMSAAPQATHASAGATVEQVGTTAPFAAVACRLSVGTAPRKESGLTCRKRSHSGADASPVTSANALSNSALAFAVLPMPAQGAVVTLATRGSKSWLHCLHG